MSFLEFLKYPEFKVTFIDAWFFSLIPLSEFTNSDRESSSIKII